MSIYRNLQRMRMWEKYIPGYGDADKNQKKKLKVAYAAERGCKPHEIQGDEDLNNKERTEFVQKLNAQLNSMPIHTHSMMVDLFSGLQNPQCQPKMAWSANVANIPIAKEETMNVNSPNPELVQREYLVNRLYDSQCRKNRELETHFGITDEDRPHTLRDALKRIKEGHYVLPKHCEDEENFDDCYSPYDLMNVLRWRDPAKKEDKKGHKAAKSKMDDAARDAKGHVMILELEKALKSVEAFEEKKFH